MSDWLFGMISAMSTNVVLSSDQNEVGRDGPSESFDGGESYEGFGCYSERMTEESSRVSGGIGNDDMSFAAKVSSSMIMTSGSEFENEDTGFGDASAEAVGIRQSFSLPNVLASSENVDARKAVLENTEYGSVVNDYNSMMSVFDVFAHKDKVGAIGYGFEIGDMVWAKVKSHPWWPGRIYNEEYASHSVRKSKGEGHMLVAFFGDSSYGWFLPAELIPFEQNFPEKSRQTNFKLFVNAVEEAVDELSRRRSLGLTCRCRNQFNFWPSGFENDFVVDVGDGPGIYSSNQINKARDSFQPKKLLSFVQRLAMAPRNHLEWTIELIKNSATVLAYRKSLFEEFDETYAQAFGTTPVRAPRPTSPMVVDPNKASLSGRLLIDEVLGKAEIFVKPAKIKDKFDKDKYLFKRRDDPSPKKIGKAASGQAGFSDQPVLVDGSEVSGRVLYSGIGDTIYHYQESSSINDQNQPSSHLTFMADYSNPSEFSGKLTDSTSKKGKLKKRPAVKLGPDHVIFKEKKKKKEKTDVNANNGQLPVVLGYNDVPIENVRSIDTLLHDSYHFERQKASVLGSTLFHPETQLDSHLEIVELPALLRDLRQLALNPSHGSHRSCLAKVRPFFLNFRSLVYQKSLILVPTDSEGGETHIIKPLPITSNVIGLIDGTSDMSVKKPVTLLARLNDSTKSGVKLPPSDHMKGVKRKKMALNSGVKSYNYVEVIREKKIGDPEGLKRKKAVVPKKKINESEDIKKAKKIEDWKLSAPAPAKKPFLRSIELQKADGKEISAKSGPLAPPKVSKLESNKKSEHSAKTPSPTMLVMKFPAGAGLPSGAELRARFARFGPMDHSATRVFWTTHTCRLVYHYIADAHAAFKFIESTSNVFGNINVRCYLKPLSAESAELDPTKILKDEPSFISNPQSRDLAVERKGISAQLFQQPVQLKSCLKNEGGNGGGSRGSARVKFALDCHESSATEQPFSYPEGASSSSYALDNNSKNFSKFIPPSNIPLSSSTLPYLSNNTQMVGGEQFSKDVSPEMLNLLNKCSDIVKDLTTTLGYMPYHSLWNEGN